MNSLPHSNRALPPTGLTPRVTVIMPIRNEEAHIADTLGQVLDQTTGELGVEILVVDGRSDDRTREVVSEIARQHPRVRLLDNPGRLSSSARNVGIREARGEFLVVIDGHCEIRNRRYLVDLVEAFERTGADCLGRPQPQDISDASLLQSAIAAARTSVFGHHPDSWIYADQELPVPALSVGVAYRRAVFDQVGEFDPCFDACEDCELNYRIDEAGLSCYLIPQLAVHYRPRNTLRGLFRQLARYGRGRIRLARKHPQTLSLKSVLPALLLSGIAGGPLVCWLIPQLWYVYWGTLAVYAGLLLAFSLAAALASGRPATLIWLPLVFVAIHLGSGWGVLRELVSFRSPARQKAAVA